MSDPERLRDGAGPSELRELIRAAEDDVLDDAATDRVRASLASALPAGAFGAATLFGRARAGPASNPWTLVLVAGAATAAAYAYFSSGSPAPQTPVTPVASVTGTPYSAPSAAEVPAPPQPASAEPARPAPSASVAPRPVASVTVRVPPREAREDAGAPSPREGLLLLQARQALERDSARALDLVRQHEREFPQSQLAPERDKLRSEAEARAAQ